MSMLTSSKLLCRCPKTRLQATALLLTKLPGFRRQAITNTCVSLILLLG